MESSRDGSRQSQDIAEDEKATPAQRRVLKNFIVKPRAQFRFLAVLWGASMISLILYFAVFALSVSRMLMQIGVNYEIDASLLQQVQDGLQVALVVGCVLLFVICIVNLGVIVVFSHRVFGPAVAINRMIQDLKEGRYERRGSLRNKDEFQEIMSNLNQLASELESKYGVGSAEKPNSEVMGNQQ